ncbi:MAG TPA: hypothetical protein VIJ67_13930 [Pseudolabrys sp.]
MENAYRPELWRDLYVMLGTSSAALIGLLFVVTSLHLNEVVSKPVFRTRAYNQTLYLLILLVEAVLVLLPQPVAILGAEMVAINLLGLWLPLNNIYNYFYKNKEASRSGGWAISRAIRYIVAFLFGLAGSAALIEHANWGMYLMTASYVFLLIAIVLNAWAIMLGIGQLEQTTKAS